MKRKTIVAGVILILVIIGGVLMFEHKQLEAEKFRKEQERVVKYIGEHIELMNRNPIEKIEFIEFQKNHSTGTWRITAIINNKFNISFSEDELGGKIETANYSLIEFKQNREISKNNKIKKIQVIYYKGESDGDR